MIILNGISHEVGRGLAKRQILDHISWEIEPRSRIVVLGHPGSGKTTLLNIVAGVVLPTEGWVERRVKIMPHTGFLRHGRNLSLYSLLVRLAEIYGADAREILRFIESVLPVSVGANVPLNRLPKQLRVQLDRAITFALPGDTYLFDGAIEVGQNPDFRNFCARAFQMRSARAGIVLATSSAKFARRFTNSFSGGILYNGKIRLSDNLEQAIDIFERLPPDSAGVQFREEGGQDAGVQDVFEALS